MEISLTNSHNQTVTLTGQEDKYQVISVTGLDPGKAVINSTTIVGVDGTRFNSARLNNRNIVINLKISSNEDENRQELYRKFPLKEEVVVAVTTGIAAEIRGRIDGLNCGLFDKSQIMQISIICDDPYFYGTSWVGNYSMSSEREKTVQATNNGEAGTGFSLRIGYDGEYLGGTNFAISSSNGQMSFKFPTGAESGVILIDTENETFTITEDGTDPVDAVPLLELGSVFPKLPAGNSDLAFNTDVLFSAYQITITVPTRLGGL